MNRLLTLRFSDGQGDQDWSYWPGGKVKRVQTRNNGAVTTNDYTTICVDCPRRERGLRRLARPGRWAMATMQTAPWQPMCSRPA